MSSKTDFLNAHRESVSLKPMNWVAGNLDKGGVTTYAYDAQDRLTGIVNPFSERATTSYDTLDRETLRGPCASMSVSHSYDAASRETALALFTNTYDPSSNRLSVQELNGSRVTYDRDGIAWGPASKT